MTTFVDKGDPADPADDIRAEIQYWSNPRRYIVSRPSSIEVFDPASQLLRKRVGSYGDAGELLALEEYTGSGTSIRHTLSYDRFGNLESITDPRGYTVHWSYDGEVHSFVTNVETRNDRILRTPAVCFAPGMELSLGPQDPGRMHPNGQSIDYAYDQNGRLTEVRSPYDVGSLAAVSYEYISTFPWTAVATNKTNYDPADKQAIRTAITI